LRKLSQQQLQLKKKEEKKIRNLTNQLETMSTSKPQEIETGINLEWNGEQMKEVKEQMADPASQEVVTDPIIEVVEINLREEREVTVEAEEVLAVGAFTMRKIMKMAVFLLMIFSKIVETTKVESEAIVVEEQEVEVSEALEVIVETEVIAMNAITEEPEEEAPIQADLEEADIGGKKKKKSIINKKTS